MEFATWFTIVVLNPPPIVCQKIHLLLHACTKLSCTWDFLLTLWAALAYLYPAFFFLKCLTSDSNSYIFSMVQLLSLHCWRWPSFQCLHLFLFFFYPFNADTECIPSAPPPLLLSLPTPHYFSHRKPTLLKSGGGFFPRHKLDKHHTAFLVMDRLVFLLRSLHTATQTMFTPVLTVTQQCHTHSSLPLSIKLDSASQHNFPLDYIQRKESKVYKTPCHFPDPSSWLSTILNDCLFLWQGNKSGPFPPFQVECMDAGK